jgi:hypothetical protein
MSFDTTPQTLHFLVSEWSIRVTFFGYPGGTRLNIPDPSKKPRYSRQHALFWLGCSLQPSAQHHLSDSELRRRFSVSLVGLLGVSFQRFEDLFRAHKPINC